MFSWKSHSNYKILSQNPMRRVIQKLHTFIFFHSQVHQLVYISHEPLFKVMNGTVWASELVTANYPQPLKSSTWNAAVERNLKSQSLRKYNCMSAGSFYSYILGLYTCNNKLHGYFGSYQEILRSCAVLPCTVTRPLLVAGKALTWLGNCTFFFQSCHIWIWSYKRANRTPAMTDRTGKTEVKQERMADLWNKKISIEYCVKTKNQTYVYI